MSEEIISSEYSEVMQKSYIDYAMSVITARAVPDVRDGLKPVQRRVLYSMSELGLRADRPHRKSARIVGDTMGKYHPHGDSSIYETLVVLSQEFKKEMPLVNGHGNFGSIEGDGAAAMRYTEARLEKFTEEVYLADLDKNVVDFIPNFDETEQEPEVLPVRIPNILLNGSEGIAVGMTTSIPTHNLGEIIDAMILYMKKKNVTTQELMECMPGPDFPTGGLVINKSDLQEIYETGSGKIKLRGKVVFEPGRRKSDRDKLVITEIPYTMIGANIGKFILDLCDFVETKKTTDIVDISNESGKEGIRIVLELKKGADPVRLENMLYKKTRLEDTFGVNMLVIAGGKPEVLGLKGILKECVEFQYEINTRKYTTLLEKDRENLEIKEGLIRACDIIDLIIEIIRGSRTVVQARNCLMGVGADEVKFKSEASKKAAEKLDFTERQAQAILELRLSKLIGLEILKLNEEYEELKAEIEKFEKILSDGSAMKKVIIKDLERIKKEYAVPRRTRLVDAEAAVYAEEKIKEQPVVFLMDRFGYAKAIDKSVYEKNAETVEAENKFVVHCMNTDQICIFTQTGVMHKVKLSKVPLRKLKDKGTPIDNLCNYTSASETIVQTVAMNDLGDLEALFVTKQGMMKLVDASEFETGRNTIQATKLAEGDEVVSISFLDNTRETVFDAYDEEPDITLSGGSDIMVSENADSDDQLIFEFIDIAGGASVEMNVSLDDPQEQPPQEAPAADQKGSFVTNKMVVLQTRDGVFLRFRIGEIPEQKKNARGVRGIKLGSEDEIDKVYVFSPGSKQTIEYKGKELELVKIKLAKRGSKGVKPRI